MPARRIVYLSLPAFATDRVGRKQPQDELGPFATVITSRGRRVLMAVNAPAQAAGLAPGQGLADARALCPRLAAAAHDQAGNARSLAAVADWCLRYTPWTAPDPLPATGIGGDAGVWLDISGCAHLFAGGADAHGEATLIADLTGRLGRAGFSARAAAADSPGGAWAMARFGPRSTAVVPPGGYHTALAALPVAALRLPPATVEALNRLGLRRIGDLHALPRAALEARFGDTDSGHVLKRLDQALGVRAEPVSPGNPRFGRPLPPWRARLALAEPIDRVEDVEAAVGHLLAELCPRLEREGRGARRLELMLFRTDATLERAEIGTSRPSRDPAHLVRLFAEALAELAIGPDAGEGIELIVLEAVVTEPLAPAQLVLDRRGDLSTAGIGPLIDRLTVRLGAANVTRLASHESHLPERAVTHRPALARAADDTGCGDRDRPVRLLRRPEPVRVHITGHDLPDRFDWRRARYDVVRAEGPERIAPEWWRANGLGDAGGPPRDYFRIEERAGGRFWLFRSGDDWFLHGLFA